jgi:secondary thiamine-phosphate synthase enzyme
MSLSISKIFEMNMMMKSFRKELWFEVPSRRAFINITSQVEECLRESGIKEGLVLCNAMHISASVFINDNERGLHQDFEIWLEKLAPEKPHSQYQHNHGEDNADAQMGNLILALGNRFFTANLMVKEKNAYWSKSLANKINLR